MDPGEAILGMTFFISLASVLILRGPIGKALGERLSGRQAEADHAVTAEIERLNGQVDDLRLRLDETEERLDFAERLLAKQKQQPALPES